MQKAGFQCDACFPALAGYYAFVRLERANQFVDVAFPRIRIPASTRENAANVPRFVHPSHYPSFISRLRRFQRSSVSFDTNNFPLVSNLKLPRTLPSLFPDKRSFASYLSLFFEPDRKTDFYIILLSSFGRNETLIRYV